VKKVKEVSSLGDIKGSSAPFGSKDTSEKNLSAPYQQLEDFIAMNVAKNGDLPEVVKKRGDHWVMFDDEKKEVVLGTFDDRETAWDKQRMHRKRKKTEKELQKKMKQRRKNVGEPKTEKTPIRKENFEFLKEKIKAVLSENRITYFFEQAPGDKDAVEWENFVEKLSKETLMSDKKFKNIIINLEKSKIKVLKNAANVVKDSLSRSKGKFQVSDMTTKRDEMTGDIKVFFNVYLKGASQELPFSIKIENARPLIHIPPPTANQLNMISSEESKLLRAELIHVQETQLNNVEDIITASEKRNNYLKTLEGKIDKFINNLQPVEIAVLKRLLKLKYKGV
jgi:hypothetical protein